MARPQSILVRLRFSAKSSSRPSVRRFSAAVTPPVFSLDLSNAYSTSFSPAQDSRARDLTRSLDNDAGPSHVWANYTTLLNSMGSRSLPLELHQQVLRHCTPDGNTHRTAIRRRIAKGTFSQSFHEHETRLQAVIQNIHALGMQPTLDDYNFILHQFAGVGYYEGILDVYKDLVRVGLTPDYKTFGNCFHAIAYRYTLPTHPDLSTDLMAQTQALFKIFMDDMQKYRVPMTATNLDLIIRILKETLDRDGLESLLRWSYGIDLNNPDRVALEYSESSSSSSSLALGEAPRTPFPFSTSALNTTLDLLGRLGDVSKLVQAFEVLTTPLPQASQHFFDSFEADDDDDFGVPVSIASSSIPLPYARPNTTTYTILLRHLCRAGHAVFARHYIIQAMRLDRVTSWTLGSMVLARRRTPARLLELPAPHFALSRLMLLPVLGEANRDKHLGLLRWLSSKMPYILRKQRADLAFYEGLLAELRAAGAPIPPIPPPNTPPLPITRVDVSDATPPPQAPSRDKPFNIALHIQILRRNIAELDDLRARLDFLLARTTQRVKERLGRRVWAQKDLFLTDASPHGGARVQMGRDRWRAAVGFQPLRKEHEDFPRARARGPLYPKVRRTPATASGEGEQRRTMSSSTASGVQVRGPLGAPRSVLASLSLFTTPTSISSSSTMSRQSSPPPTRP